MTKTLPIIKDQIGRLSKVRMTANKNVKHPSMQSQVKRINASIAEDPQYEAWLEEARIYAKMKADE